MSSYNMDHPVNHNAVHNCKVRNGKTTYLVDVKEAKDGKKYLAITEYRLDADNRKEPAPHPRVRRSRWIA